MESSRKELGEGEYDVLVIGGGIYGACVAWDAAQRGLATALVEQGDFGGATSANSLKIVHGGLRYLQDGNLRLVRAMIQERSTWLRIAPHLVHPLPFVMPTFPQLSRSKVAMGVALAINDALGFDRNRDLDREQQLANGRILSRAEIEEKMGWIDPRATGGAMWSDAQIYNTERLLMAIIMAAVTAGARAANYMRVDGFVVHGRRISGVQVVDERSDQRLLLRAKQIVNCSGAWSDHLLGLLGGRVSEPGFRQSAAYNLVVRKRPMTCAVGFPSSQAGASGGGGKRTESRLLFVTPWQGCSIIGTWHVEVDDAQHFQVSEGMIKSAIAEVNRAYPTLDLKWEDLIRVHCGFLPLAGRDAADGTPALLRESVLRDHDECDEIENMITVTGVKYTTARLDAEQAVDLVLRKLARPAAACRTAVTAVDGGAVDSFRDYLATAVSQRPAALREESVCHLVNSYGSNYAAVVELASQDPHLAEPVRGESPVIQAEVVYAARREMAQKLTDVVYRRLPLTTTDAMDGESLQLCARLMARELDWGEARVEEEIEAANKATSDYGFKRNEESGAQVTSHAGE